MEEIIKISALILSILFTIGFAKLDSEHINKDHYFKDHDSRTFLRLIFFLSIALTSPLYAFGFAFIFWALFDQTLNSMRNLSFWNLGSTSKTDIFFNKRKGLYKASKFLSLLIGLILFIL